MIAILHLLVLEDPSYIVGKDEGTNDFTRFRFSHEKIKDPLRFFDYVHPSGVAIRFDRLDNSQLRSVLLSFSLTLRHLLRGLALSSASSSANGLLAAAAAAEASSSLPKLATSSTLQFISHKQ